MTATDEHAKADAQAGYVSAVIKRVAAENRIEYGKAPPETCRLQKGDGKRDSRRRRDLSRRVFDRGAYFRDSDHLCSR